MKKSLSVFAILFTYCLHAQPSDNKADPTVRTASGIVRGVTDGEVSSFKGKTIWLQRVTD